MIDTSINWIVGFIWNIADDVLRRLTARTSHGVLNDYAECLVQGIVGGNAG